MPTETPSETPPAPSVFRFEGDDIPSWMQGKTPAEVAAITTNLYNAYQQSQSPGYQAPAPSADPIPQQTPSSPVHDPTPTLSPPSADLMYSDPAAYQAQYDAYMRGLMQQSISQIAAPFAQASADTARELSRMGPFADVWRRWEPEIEMKMQGIPLASRTRALYDQAAQMVRADHLDELAEERAQQLMSQGATGTERGLTGSAPPAAQQDALDEAWDSGHPFFEGMKQEGMTKTQVREFCARTGQSVESYVAGARLGSLVPTKHGIVRSS